MPDVSLCQQPHDEPWCPEAAGQALTFLLLPQCPHGMWYVSSRTHILKCPSRYSDLCKSCVVLVDFYLLRLVVIVWVILVMRAAFLQDHFHCAEHSCRYNVCHIIRLCRCLCVSNCVSQTILATRRVLEPASLTPTMPLCQPLNLKYSNPLF